MDTPVFFTSDLTSAETKVDLSWTLAHLKQRLERTTGIAPQFQKLQYYSSSTSNEFRVLDADDAATLASFGIAPFCRIHVADTDPDSKLAQLYDEGQTAGFQLSEEDYAKRADSVLQWKKDQQLGRYDPQFQQQQELSQMKDEQMALKMSEGQRCRVINIEGERRGTVRYVGKIAALDGGKSPWIGVEFDEPAGKNDGLIGDVRVFSGRAGHCSFLRPAKVEVGDFPELDMFDSDDEEI